ncbi:C40 family peptidase [Streptomyces sp. NPDC101062]|uniref:C40 family peptidase n=1 Tax=unclassified Streptomyces TaxID=2593676 RepID=UPI002E76A5F6|nr:C40 family peptidase [Streptomyces sp. JV176]MEE1803738.1 C40 family peptidase [Streptomyces sp. JV176]
MSHTAQIPSHRKPRRSTPRVTLRAGVAGGVLSTIAVAGAAAPANAEPVTETIEMPTLTAGLAGDFARSADATQRVANTLDLQAQQDAAAAKAAKTAKTAKAEAERKAEAKRKAEEARVKAAKAAEAAERASRSTERTTLASTSNSDSGSSTGSSSSSNTVSETTSQATGSAASVVAFAQAQVGDAYIMGSTGPNAWDCSGLVQAAFSQIGVDLPRVSQDQSVAGTQVSLDNLQPGDILYWGGAGSAYHTAIYIGGGEFIGAQNPSKGVVKASLDYDPPSGAVRVL